MNVNLSDELKAYVVGKVTSGEFDSVEDVISDALRLHQQDPSDDWDQDELRQLILDGINSGPGVELTDELIQSIKDEGRRLAATRRGRETIG